MEENIRLLIPYDLQFFAKEGPGGEKTEPATAKKLKDAREEGQVAKSKELSGAVELIALFIILKVFMEYISSGMLNTFYMIYNKIPDFILNSAGGFTIRSSGYLLYNVLLQIIKITIPIFLIGVLISFLVDVVQVKWKVTAKPMQPKLSKFNPINGLKRMFSMNSLFELLKSFLKIAVIGIMAYICLKKNANAIFIIYDMPLTQAIGYFGKIALDMGLKISILYLVIGFADYLYQKHKFNEDTKMTKQEVKDEYKNSEGNPEIRSRQRQVMREASRKRMMQDVPKADVIITNPTHLAVAIKYDQGVNTAPVVLAKGEDYLAQKIKEVAREHDIEIVENKPLARMLYTNVDIGQEIPPELYQAVAEVLAYVYNLKNVS